MQMNKWRQRVRQLKGEVYALYLAYKDPRVPWYARLWVAIVVSYALSPIDLIPDFIPVLGYLDDLLLIPLGIMLAIKLIPEPVLSEYRVQAQAEMAQNKPKSWITAAVIVILWLMMATILLIPFIK